MKILTAHKIQSLVHGGTPQIVSTAHMSSGEPAFVGFYVGKNFRGEVQDGDRILLRMEKNFNTPLNVRIVQDYLSKGKTDVQFCTAENYTFIDVENVIAGVGELMDFEIDAIQKNMNQLHYIYTQALSAKDQNLTHREGIPMFIKNIERDSLYPAREVYEQILKMI